MVLFLKWHGKQKVVFMDRQDVGVFLFGSFLGSLVVTLFTKANERARIASLEATVAKLEISNKALEVKLTESKDILLNYEQQSNELKSIIKVIELYVKDDENIRILKEQINKNK